MVIRICKHESELNFKVQLPILAQENYIKVKSEEYGWFDSDIYAMPFYIEQRLIFRRLVLPYGPVLKKGKDDVDNQKDFFDSCLKVLAEGKEVKIDYLSQPQSNVVLPFKPSFGTVVPWGSYIIDLTRTEDEIFSSFHTKHKNVIRKAAKEGVTVDCKADYHEVWQNICETLDRQKVYPPQLSYYQKLVENVPDNMAFYTCKLNGEIQGSAVIVYDNYCAYYMYGGSAPRPYTGSVNLLQFEIMKDMKAKGVKEYDMVGARTIYEEDSKFAGIQRFKSRFASDFKQGYILRMIIKPVKYKLFLFCVKIAGLLKGFKYSDSIDDILRLMKKRNLTIKDL